MRKEKMYFNTKFTSDVLLEAKERVLESAGGKQGEVDRAQRIVQTAFAEGWEFDSDDEFFVAYAQNVVYAVFELWQAGIDLAVIFKADSTEVKIRAPERETIVSISCVFESAAPNCSIKPVEKGKKPTVFIGHGRSDAWKALKDHLHEQHGFEVVAYEIGARAGHAIRDILEEMLDKSSFALLVMTGEDTDENGQLHARENVIHELGLFQGRLGFSRAIVLLEEKTTEFSNISGIHQIRFRKRGIRETFGDVLATIRREFGGL